MDIRPALRQKARSAQPANFKRNCCVCKKSGRYCQPIRPKSYAPVNQYQKPTNPMESCTIYRKSYLPATAPIPKPIIHNNTLGACNAKFANETIHRMSYPGWCGIKPPEPIMRCDNIQKDCGPMQEITTHRHDFVPKPYIKSEPVMPANNIYSCNQPVSDKTINRLSYQPICNFEKSEPIMHKGEIKQPAGPMSSCTIQNMSYRPVPIPPKEDLPWAKRQSYTNPCVPMSGDTIYRKSYPPNCQIEKTEPIMPPTGTNPLTACSKFEDKTIFRMSYQPIPGVKPEMILPRNTLEVCKQKMETCTINRMSYLPNYGFRPPEPLSICDHDLVGKGPMQEITTTRHDYVPKPFIRIDPIMPKASIPISNEPISCKTINRLSYQPICNYEMSKPIIPCHSIDRPKGPMECRTIQNMSYRPVVCPEKTDMPWIPKKGYDPPATRMACETIYNLSYDAPGDLCDDCNCRCADETPCPPPCVNPITA